jgi:hypothetical protein
LLMELEVRMYFEFMGFNFSLAGANSISVGQIT